MPTFQWIETGPSRADYCGGYQMTPAELRAEVWLAIAGGARGIGYFTHTWSPDHDDFDVSAPLVDQMIKTNSLLAALQPGARGRDDPVLVRLGLDQGRGPAGGTDDYVIAVNAVARRQLDSQFHVPALRRRAPERLRRAPQRQLLDGPCERYVSARWPCTSTSRPN